MSFLCNVFICSLFTVQQIQRESIRNQKLRYFKGEEQNRKKNKLDKGPLWSFDGEDPVYSHRTGPPTLQPMAGLDCTTSKRRKNGHIQLGSKQSCQRPSSQM
ncbi:hypothetical protein ILYODFUR_025952 [Ilyodon furcidens]|uniref:Uncharacterized protein n=1 Tax=Ilyodon furcidens TaxID=33524 RepID=A0ABV0UL07_9TELE